MEAPAKKKPGWRSRRSGETESRWKLSRLKPLKSDDRQRLTDNEEIEESCDAEFVWVATDKKSELKTALNCNLPLGDSEKQTSQAFEDSVPRGDDSLNLTNREIRSSKPPSVHENKSAAFVSSRLSSDERNMAPHVKIDCSDIDSHLASLSCILLDEKEENSRNERICVIVDETTTANDPERLEINRSATSSETSCPQRRDDETGDAASRKKRNTRQKAKRLARQTGRSVWHGVRVGAKVFYNGLLMLAAATNMNFNLSEGAARAWRQWSSTDEEQRRQQQWQWQQYR